MQLAQAQGPEPDPPQALFRERLGETERGQLVARAPSGQQQPDRLLAQTTRRELEDARRRPVEPLRVVHGDHHRPGLGKRAKQAEKAKRDSALPGRIVACLGEDERQTRAHAAAAREAAATSPRQTLQQIPESRERETGLGAGRPAERTRQPASSAARTPACHTVVLPIPASPSTTNAHGPSASASMNPARAESSSALPISSLGMFVVHLLVPESEAPMILLSTAFVKCTERSGRDYDRCRRVSTCPEMPAPTDQALSDEAVRQLETELRRRTRCC